MDYATAVQAKGAEHRADAILQMVMERVADGRLAWSIKDLEDAGILGKSEAYEEIARGKLLAVKRGRSTKILAPDLVSYLQGLVLIAPHPPDRKPDPKAIARGKMRQARARHKQAKARSGAQSRG
jgi:hypothetical protein